MATMKDAYTDEQNARMEALYDATNILGGKSADIEQVVKVAEYILTGRWGHGGIEFPTKTFGLGLGIDADKRNEATGVGRNFEVDGKPAVLHYSVDGAVSHAICPGQNNLTGLREYVTCDECKKAWGITDERAKGVQA